MTKLMDTTAKNQNWELGQNGEELASNFLMQQGYRILHRNWNLHRGCELDLVAMKNNELHFFEVKTRSSEHLKGTDIEIRPEQAINKSKLRNITRAVYHYINTYYNGDLDCHPMHINAIGIIYKSEQDYSINIIPDIPFAPFTRTSYYSRPYKNRRY